MRSVALDFVDADMPRTVYYDQIIDALRAQPNYVDCPTAAEIVFPAEDTALETNWPRYGRMATAFTRGTFEFQRYVTYLAGLLSCQRHLCIINMNPGFRMHMMGTFASNIIVSDINLLLWERMLNPRTISMPANPITTGRFQADEKHILAGFRGVETHPCRRELAALHNGTTIRVELVELTDRKSYCNHIDASNGIADPAYTALMRSSIFALVPRGDAEFSYRLLEAMSFGCIPVIIADGLVLPFDRTIPWPDISLHLPETRIALLPQLLASLPPQRVFAMQCGVRDIYTRHFSDMQTIVQTLLGEIEVILRQDSNRSAAEDKRHVA